MEWQKLTPEALEMLKNPEIEHPVLLGGYSVFNKFECFLFTYIPHDNSWVCEVEGIDRSDEHILNTLTHYCLIEEPK